MEELILEISKSMDIVNDKIYEAWDGSKDEFPSLILQYNGYAFIIEFLASTIWSSEDDEREYDEDKDEYEDLSKFLIRKVNILLSMLSYLKLKED